MSTRSVIVRLEAEVAGYVAGFGKAAQATDDMVKKTAQAKKSIGDNSQAMQTAGRTLLGFGATSVAALGASTKAAMDWESAWAGVRKTTDGSPEQMAALEKELRGLAKTLPSTHAEIAGVAEAAGQLGIERENVAAFPKTMIDLGETTNLSAEEAATGLARFSNIMGTSQTEVSRLGSTLVGLGNNFATTEAEILSMSMRLAGAGQQAGLTEGDVLGLATAASSVGIEAEAGGTAISMVMKKIAKEVETGGDKLETFSKVAGMSSDQFSKAWRDDAGGALALFIKGLSDTESMGKSTSAVLDDLGIKGIREADAMLRMSSAHEIVAEAMRSGNEEFEKNTALANEAAQRYETTESKIKVAWNNIKDAAIDAGAVMLPVLQGVAESVSGLAQTFGSLPAPVQGTLTVLTGVVGVSALLAGGLLTVIPKIAETHKAFKDLNASGSKIPGTMGKIAKVAGIAAAAYAALATAAALAASATDDDRTKTSVEDFNNALVGIATNGDAARKSVDAVFSGVTKTGNSMFTAVDDLDSAMSRIFNPTVSNNISDFFSTALGQNATSAMNATKAAVGNLDKSIASMAQSGNFEDAAAGFQLAADAAEAQGKPVSELIELFPEYKAAVLATKTANGETQVSQEALTEAMLKADPAADNAAAAQAILDESLQETGVALDAVIEDMDKFLEQLFATGQITMSARDANAAYHEALRDIPETLKTIAESNGEMGRTLNDAATDFDRTTKAGALANSAFQNVARKGMAEVEAKAKEGLGQPELQEKLSQTYTDLVKSAEGMGITGDAAIDLAREVLGVPDGVDIHSWMDDRAKRMAEQTKGAMDAIDGRVVRTYAEHLELTIKRTEVQVRGDSGSGGDPSLTAFDPGTFAPGRATGGPIVGPGTGTSDDVPIWASNGEHMLTTADVRAMGGHGSVYRFRNQLHQGTPGYANGGHIGTAVSSTQIMVHNQAGAAAAPIVSSPDVRVFIGNEQIDARIEIVAGGVVQRADAQSSYIRKGR